MVHLLLLDFYSIVLTITHLITLCYAVVYCSNRVSFYPDKQLPDPPLQQTVLLDGPRTGLCGGQGPISIHAAIERLQRRRTQSHHHGAQHEQAHAAFKRNLFKDWIRVPGRLARRK